jgi:hypothetical protein
MLQRCNAVPLQHGNGIQFGQRVPEVCRHGTRKRLISTSTNRHAGAPSTTSQGIAVLLASVVSDVVTAIPIDGGFSIMG